ncbi:MAG TPA: M50 family metallopeptidase [Nitrososphaeraceae archaeon]
MQEQSKVRVERKFVLFLIHTPFGLNFFDRIARTKAARVYSEFSTYLMPLITVLAIALFFIGLTSMLSNSAAREGVRDIGPQANLLIPGLNPLLPWTYGWIALVVTIVIHEAGHGIVARVYNAKVESTGLVLFLIFPIGAFVNIQREELEKTPLRRKCSILTAGPLNNMILAVASLIALYFVVSSLSPLPGSDENPSVMVGEVRSGSLAEELGITQGSTIQSIDGKEIVSLSDVGQVLRSSEGETINVIWTNVEGNVFNKSGQNVNGLLGVTINGTISPSDALDSYKGAFLDPRGYIRLLIPPTLEGIPVPYSDSMAPKYESDLFGPYFPVISNLLFWLWFINFNVGLFNALPIGPFDGGQLYGSLIENKLRSMGSKLNPSTVNSAITFIFIIIVIMLIAGPYLLR